MSPGTEPRAEGEPGAAAGTKQNWWKTACSSKM